MAVFLGRGIRKGVIEEVLRATVYKGADQLLHGEETRSVKLKEYFMSAAQRAGSHGEETRPARQARPPRRTMGGFRLVILLVMGNTQWKSEFRGCCKNSGKK